VAPTPAPTYSAPRTATPTAPFRPRIQTTAPHRVRHHRRHERRNHVQPAPTRPAWFVPRKAERAIPVVAITHAAPAAFVSPSTASSSTSLVSAIFLALAGCGAMLLLLALVPLGNVQSPLVARMIVPRRFDLALLGGATLVLVPLVYALSHL
jgi:hypothetical protein